MLLFKLIIVVYFVVCRDITTVKYICGVSAMGKILGIAIKNYGSLKDIKMGQLYSGQTGVPLGNMVAIIGPSGNGKSTLADAFGFIADALTTDVESACDASNRGGYDKLVSQGSNGPIHFEIYYKENRKVLDPNGNELEATDSTIIKLAQEQSEASLSYQDEIPWGVCRLLQLFQGTNYQDI